MTIDLPLSIEFFVGKSAFSSHDLLEELYAIFFETKPRLH